MNKVIKKQSILVVLILLSGKNICGELNINGYDRLSDFLNNDTDTHLKLYQTIISKESPFIIIPKINVLYYKPIDQ